MDDLEVGDELEGDDRQLINHVTLELNVTSKLF